MDFLLDEKDIEAMLKLMTSLQVNDKKYILCYITHSSGALPTQRAAKQRPIPI